MYFTFLYQFIIRVSKINLNKLFLAFNIINLNFIQISQRNNVECSIRDAYQNRVLDAILSCFDLCPDAVDILLLLMDGMFIGPTNILIVILILFKFL